MVILIILGQLVIGITLIILPIKIWIMTNDVSAINKKNKTTFAQIQQANIQFLTGDIDQAEKLLMESFVQTTRDYYRTFKKPEPFIDAFEKDMQDFLRKSAALSPILPNNAAQKNISSDYY